MENNQNLRLLNNEVLSVIFLLGRILVRKDKIHWGRCEGPGREPRVFISCTSAHCLAEHSVLLLPGFSSLAVFFFICEGFTMQGQPFLQWSSCGERKQSFRVLWTFLSKSVLEAFLSGRSRWNNSSFMGYSSTKGPLRSLHAFSQLSDLNSVGG